MEQTGLTDATLVMNNEPCFYQTYGRPRGCSVYWQDWLLNGTTVNTYAPNGYYRAFNGRR